MSFPRTKIQPPQARAHALLARPALEAALGAALLSQRLVLVCAAAGYGKTTALARQWALLPAGTARLWLACDPTDTLAQCLECLVAALEPLDPPWRSDPQALVRAADEAVTPVQRQAVVGQWVNLLEACEVTHGVIVFDDLHRIVDSRLHVFLDQLLERLGPRWTLALATRHEPPLALARLRARGELAEFRLEALRFAPDEAQALGSAAGFTETESARLHARTEGWPAGLRLGLASRAGAGSTIDRHAFDFLASEVIAGLEPALREFLLATSVLPELTAARAAALSGDAQAALRLEQIDRAGLFVTLLDADEPTLRLHDLFREALQATLARERPAQWLEMLHRAAATETDAARRVAWLQQAGDWDAAEAALEEAAEALIVSGALATVRSLFDAFPPARRAGSARLQMLLARARWDWDAAVDPAARMADEAGAAGHTTAQRVALSHRCVALAGANRHAEGRAACAALLARPGLPADVEARTLGALAWLTLARGDQREVAALWARLIDILQRAPHLAPWAESVPLPAYVGLPGMRPLLQRYLAGAALRWPEAPTPMRGMCHVLQGWLHLWAGDVAAAQASAAAAEDDARWLARPVGLDSPLRSLQAMLAALHGDTSALAQAQAQVAQVEASGVPLRAEVYGSLYQLLALRVAALLGDTAAVRVLAQRLAVVPAVSRSWLAPPQLAVAQAHLALLDGRDDEARQRWQALLDDPAQGDIYGQRVDARLRLADLLLRRGDAPAAAALLGPWLAVAVADGEWGAALLAGPALLARLAGARWPAPRSPGAPALLAPEALASLARLAEQSARLAATGQAPAPASAAPADGPLTQRERDVLARLAAGDSNKLIARAFDISPHTVKRHVANILDKLGLASRGQAAAWHREHG